MIKHFYTLLFLLLVGSGPALAQKVVVSGFTKDIATGESIIGATISQENGRGMVATNQYGFYSVTLPTGKNVLRITHVNYQPKVLEINLKADTTLDIQLVNKELLTQEVIVTAVKRESNVQSAQMGKVTMPIEQIKAMPALLGEVDILKTIQLMPGVRNAGEGSTGLYVRGGGADQNLILLDDAVVYNTGHLFGFFSIFNADAIKNLVLIKGGMPAQYGGRLSSVIDVSMKDGNNQEFQAEGGIGLIASRLSLQGPIKKNKASYILSGRHTYIDVLTKPFINKDNQFAGSGYYFYDLNAKVNYELNKKNHFYLSGYFGRDVFTFLNDERSLEVKVPWGNATATARWNHIFNNKLFSNTTAVLNDYDFTFSGSQNDFDVSLASGIRDLGLKQDFDFYPKNGHKIKFGANFTYHNFRPSTITGKQDSVTFNPQNAQIKYANEYALYLQDEMEINEKLSLNAGLRYSLFQQLGPFKRFETDEFGNRLDSVVYKKGKTVKVYGGFEPRLTLRYELNKTTSIKGGITRNLQYIHLVSNSGTTLPTDIWVPSTYIVQPQKSWMYALGLFKNFGNNTYESSVEVYYKDMRNQIEYREGYTPNTLKDVEEDFVFGKGWSYGSEFFINKVRGNLTGWVGYTLSFTWRKFPLLNEAMRFPAKYDRRHDLSVVASYKINDKWRLSSSFIYGTGNAATLPVSFYLIDGTITQQYSRINQYRLPAYHRLDFSAVLTPANQQRKRIKSEWVFGIYNVYNRKNPYFIYFDQEGSPYDGSLKIQGKQVSIFPIIPSVTWNFKF